MQLEIEREALKKEDDEASAARSSAVELEIADLRARSDSMKARWQNEKSAIADLSKAKERKAERAAEQQEETHERRDAHLSEPSTSCDRFIVMVDENMPRLCHAVKGLDRSLPSCFASAL